MSNYNESYLAGFMSETQADKMIEGLLVALPGRSESMILLQEMKYAIDVEEHTVVFEKFVDYVTTSEHEAVRLFNLYLSMNNYDSMVVYMETFIAMSPSDRKTELENLKQFVDDAIENEDSNATETMYLKISGIFNDADLLEVGDYSALETFIENIETPDPEVYTSGSIAELEANINAANNAIAGNPNMNQYQLDKLQSAIQTAIDSLTEKTVRDFLQELVTTVFELDILTIIDGLTSPDDDELIAQLQDLYDTMLEASSLLENPQTPTETLQDKLDELQTKYDAYIALP